MMMMTTKNDVSCHKETRMNPFKKLSPPQRNKCPTTHKQITYIQKIKREKRYKRRDQLRDIASPLRGKISVKKPAEMIKQPKVLPELRESRPDEREGEV